MDHDRAKRIAADFFNILEILLAQRRFAIGDHPSLVDIAGYSYISKAPEGGISLDPYPAIRAWLRRIEALSGFIPFPETKAGLLAAESLRRCKATSLQIGISY